MWLLTKSRRFFRRQYVFVFLAVLMASGIIILCSLNIDVILPLGRETFSQKSTNKSNTTYNLDPNPSSGKDIILSLVRNSELEDMKQSIISFERSFNSKFHYDWWFMNDQDFDEEFKTEITPLVSGEVKFLKIPEELWSYPDYIDQNKAAEARENYGEQKIMYGKSESYRFMCRFNSGMFYKLPDLQDIDYYWRVEPAVRFDCDITYDVFKYMRENNKLYAFNMALQEDVKTIPTLWDSTKNFFIKNPDLVARNNNMKFITDDDGTNYNLCHFWSNFEIASLSFYRDSGYDKYFEYLDKQGGFFYERWGDAPVHTLAVSIMLPADKIHFVANTGYFHNPNQDCPVETSLRQSLKCNCNPRKDFTWHKWSCVNKFFDIHNYVRPNSLDSLKNNYPAIYDTIQT